jgi:hypothetical protein
MTTASEHASATLLGNGRVLAAGGGNPSALGSQAKPPQLTASAMHGVTEVGTKPRAGYAREVETGPYIQTVSGRRVNPFAPDPTDLDIGDIANALSHQCRFGGHSRDFYSVAQHSCLAADLVLKRGGGAEAALWALLHDASEAYLVDLPHPIKHRSELGRLYAEAEGPLQAAILVRFGLPLEPPPLLKDVDRALLATERRAVAQVAWHWPELKGFEPLDMEIDPWPPERAREEFLRRYERLEAAR